MRTNRKFLGYCEICKKSLCPEHSYCYTDGNNIAITNSSPYLCKECYEKKYNEKIKDEVAIFKENLIKGLLDIKFQNKIECLNIDKLVKYIEIL